MRRQIFKVLIGVILLVFVISGIINLFGANLLAGVLEKTVGAPVKVGRLHVGLLTSSLGLYRFEIHNPPGFREKKLAEIREISVKYDLLALLTGKVHLKRMRLDFGDITLEKSAAGKVNLMEIGAMKPPKKQPSPEPQKTEPAPQKTQSPKKAPKPVPLQIDEVAVNIGKVYYIDSAREPPLRKTLDLGIRNETFYNMTDAFGLVKQIVFLILRKAGVSSLGIFAQEIGAQLESTFNSLKSRLFKS